MALDVAMIMRLVDRFSGPAKRMEQRLDGISQRARKVGTSSAGIDRMERSTKRAARGTELLHKAAYRAGSGIGFLLRRMAGGAVTLAGWGAAAGLAAAGWFGFNIIKIASDFEQFQIVLEGVEGSAEKARASMAWVREFAKTTPYEVSQVMEAFVRMRAYGIDPMDGSLKSMGNAASAMNKQLMDAVEMMADAQTGEFERLKEFGIRAKKQGDKVAFSYSKNGKDMVKTAKNSSSEIRKALTEIMDERFGGMMERQSQTLAGLWSNIKDMGAGFMLDVADAGIFDLIKAKAKAAFDQLSVWAKDGTLKAWAVSVSDSLEVMVQKASDFVTGTDWAAVAQGVAGISSAIITLIGWIGKAIEMMVKLQNAVTTGMAYMAASGQVPLLNQKAGVAYLTKRQKAIDAARLKNSKLFQGGGGPDPAKALGLPPIKLPKTTKTSMAPQVSKIQLDVRTPAGTEAKLKPTKMAANTSITLNRGKAMAGAA